jgi:adenine deaminase
VVIGCDDQSMMTRRRSVRSMNGGYAINGTLGLPLPIGGLMCDDDIARVARDYADLLARPRELARRSTTRSWP